MASVLITGANRGIGLELARQLRRRGDHVVAVVRHCSPALAELDCEVHEGVDVRQPSHLSDLASRLAGKRLDLVINNAGILGNESLGQIGPQEVERMLEQYRVNALAPVLLAQSLVPCLSAGARFVIITSRMGSIADNSSGGSYGYRMSKAAANAAGMSLARDLAERGVSVYLLHPGYVRTDMTGGRGLVEATEAAANIVALIDRLAPGDSGGFFHASGELLPW